MFAQMAAWSWSQILEPRTLVFVMCGAVGLTAIILPQWRRVREVEASTRLKHKLIDRGFSADEIERVLKAGDEDETSISS